MIRCMVTATDSSERLTDAEGLTATKLLLASIRQGDPEGKRIELVDSADVADIVLFAESHSNPNAVRHVLAHPLYRQFRQKTVVHSGMDYPDPAIPGLYPSIDKRWAPGLCCEGSPYLTSLNPYLSASDPEVVSIDVLGNFMGACSGKPIREQLLKVAQSETWSDIVVTDSGSQFVKSFQAGDADTHQFLKRKFAQDLKRSKFVLCPAGDGPSSFRIFEAMQSARAPVVIADTWAAPPGPDWSTFLLTVPERDLAHLPEILRKEDGAWRQKGKLARQAWEQYFDPSTFGPHIVERAAAVLSQANAHAFRRRARAWVYINGPRRVAALHRRLAQKLA